MPNTRSRLRSLLAVLAIIVVITGGLAFNLDWPPNQVQGFPLGTTAAVPAGPALTPATIPSLPVEDAGLAIFSTSDGNSSHLYAFDPFHAPYRFYQLTNGDWDDIHPAISPDGRQVAYASHQNGYWNICLLELATGEVARLTNTPTYDGHPDWSPDGRLIVYESMVEDNLEIMVLDRAAPDQSPLRLTHSPNTDHSPVWSPLDQKIAFLSAGANGTEVLIADLTAGELAYQSVASQSDPKSNLTWSPDGTELAWSSVEYGSPAILTAQIDTGSTHPVVSGSVHAWSPDGGWILSQIQQPNRYEMALFQKDTGQMIPPATTLQSRLHGVDWSSKSSPAILSPVFPQYDVLPGQTVYREPSNQQFSTAIKRADLIALDGVSAPFPYLVDGVDDSFQQLRAAVSLETGWDVLSSLEQAYRPLSAPSDPADRQDWLVTGRAFAINRLPLSAGWLALQMERFDGQTYWRVFAKAILQDGSQGEPLRDLAWNLDARNSGQPAAFEQGGSLQQTPGGYWVDLTDLALRYGWERLPALQNWRTYYPAARFNQWVLPGPYSWQTAMDALYPPEAIKRPTTVPTLDPTLAVGKIVAHTAAPSTTARPAWTPPALPGSGK